MATHSSVLAWRVPGTGEPEAAVYGVAQSWTRLKQLSSSSIPLYKHSIALSVHLSTGISGASMSWLV